jgi:hypothetical protein
MIRPWGFIFRKRFARTGVVQCIFHASVYELLYVEAGVRYWGHSTNFVDHSTEHVICVCVRVCVCVCRFCNVFVCESYIMCGCFANMYTRYCTLTEVFINLTEVSLTLTEVFPCFFLGCKTNAKVKLAKTGHGPHSSSLVVICVVRLLFVLF